MKKVYLIAVVFALIAGFATYMFASEINKKTTIKDADVVEIYVPAADVARNTAIKAEMFAEDSTAFVKKTVVKDDVPANVATSPDQLIDMVTVDKLYAGEAINLNRVQPIDGKDVSLSLKLKPGNVAYSFSAGSVTSVDGYISEGDSVDVMVTKTGDDGKKTSEIAYKDLKIMRVSTRAVQQSAEKSGAAITEYSTLTVEVTKDQALELYDIENNYSFKLILNQRTPDEVITDDANQDTAA